MQDDFAAGNTLAMAKQSSGPALPVLLTRPKAQGEAFARDLAARFGTRVRPVLSPLMAPSFLTPDLPEGPFAAVIFTSATGVTTALPVRAGLPARAFCVGQKTAEAARAAGFQPTSADGDAEALLSLILANPPAGRLLHLRGLEARGDLAGRLSAAGIPTIGLVTYRQDPQALSPEALALLQAPGPVILPLFSPRSATMLIRVLPPDAKAMLYLAALSPTVAKAANFPSTRLITAARPDADAMLAAIAELIVAAAPP